MYEVGAVHHVFEPQLAEKREGLLLLSFLGLLQFYYCFINKHHFEMFYHNFERVLTNKANNRNIKGSTATLTHTPMQTKPYETHTINQQNLVGIVAKIYT